MKSTRADWLVFVALGLIWGSSYLFIKIAVPDFGTFTLVALRLVIGAALLWTVLWRAKHALPRSPRTYGHLLVMALINITLPFLLITWAERSVASGLAAVLTSIVPLFAVVLAHLFIHDERMRMSSVVGLVVGFIGVIVLTGPSLGDGSNLAEDIALIGSSLCYAAGGVYARRNVRGLQPMIPAVLQVTFAMLVTSAFALALEHPWDARPSNAGILSIVWLGLLGSGAAYLCFFRLLSRWGATRTTAVAYLIPAVGIILGALVLAEPLSPRVIFGTLLIVGGVALVSARGAGTRLLDRIFRPEAPRAPGAS